MKNLITFENIEQYILNCPVETQAILRDIWKLIKEKAPDSEEKISYGMPSFKTNGRQLVYFAAFKKHIGFYATPTGHEMFKNELSGYKQGKGSVQFPLNKPIPLDLIGRIVEFRVLENQERAKK